MNTPESVARPQSVPLFWGLALLCIAMAAYLFATTSRNTNQSTDYTQDYLSAKAIFAGKSIYTPLSEESVGITENPRLRVNDHPPPYVVALAPLALLSYTQAFLILSVASCVAIIGSGLLLGVGYGWGLVGGCLVALLLLLHPGTGTGLLYGNISSLLLALIVVAWWLAGHNRSLLAGACVGFAAGLKLFPGLLVFVFLITRDFRAAIVAAGVAVGCWVGAASVVGVADVRTYIRDRAPENARAFIPSAFNESVAGVAYRTFGEPDPNTDWLERAAVRPDLVAVVLWAGRAAVVLLVLVGFLRSGRTTSSDRAFALLVPAMLLLSPLTWLHAIPMMVIPVTYLAATATTPRWQFALGVCVLTMSVSDLWMGVMLASHFGPGVPWWGNFILLAPAWGMFAVLILVAISRSPLR